jgi:hypothetical protein
VFVVWTREFLDDLVETGRSPMNQDLFYVRLRDEMREAWKEVQPHFNDLLHAVHTADQQRLLAHGLGGFQLHFKLATVRELFQIYTRAGSRRALRRLLEAADTLLDSIVGATTVGSAVVEIKDTIKNCIKADPS